MSIQIFINEPSEGFFTVVSERGEDVRIKEVERFKPSSEYDLKKSVYDQMLLNTAEKWVQRNGGELEK